ncbi:PIN domain-containing protein [Streptomyces sp. NPDC055157]
MIILDTNQFESLRPPRGPVLRVLSRIAGALGGTLALPEMVLIEHMAHKRNRVAMAVEGFKKAAQILNGELEHSHNKKKLQHSFGDARVDQSEIIRQYEEALKDEIPTVLSIPQWAAREALVREAERRAPAQTRWDSTPGKGARDVSIWLTVLETASKNPGEIVHFISEDKGFGGQTGLSLALQQELQDWKEGPLTNVRYYPTVSNFLDMVAAEQKTSLSTEQVGTSPLVATEVLTALENSEATHALEQAAQSAIPESGSGVTMTSTTSYGTQLNEITRLEKSSAYAMPGVGWATCLATWKISGKYDIEATKVGGEQGDKELFAGTVSVWGPFQSVLVCELDGGGEITAVEVTEVRVFRGATLSVAVGD